jgi:thiol:disulfide interchange protein
MRRCRTSGAVLFPRLATALLVLLPLLASACSGQTTPPTTSGEPGGAARSSTDWPPLKFEPGRDAAKDLERAIADATSMRKRIILDVGGEWCSWCHILDAFIADHPELSQAIARDYMWLKINMSPENENTAFLSRYPKIPGYPHLFVLEKDGTLLHSQDTVELEEGKSYNLGRVRGFVERWKLGG